MVYYWLNAHDEELISDPVVYWTIETVSLQTTFNFQWMHNCSFFARILSRIENNLSFEFESYYRRQKMMLVTEEEIGRWSQTEVNTTLYLDKLQITKKWKGALLHVFNLHIILELLLFGFVSYIFFQHLRNSYYL